MHAADHNESWQRHRDEQHLSLLAIFHYVYGGLTLLGGCVGLVYLFAAGIIFASPELADGEDLSPGAIGGLLAVIGGCLMIFAFGLGALVIYAGMSLANHRHYYFCIVIAALICLNIPLGTILGVFTIVVLARPSVQRLFEPVSMEAPL